MSNRSTNLIGQVLGNLKHHGITASDIQDPEIYSELSAAQDNIISEVNTDKIVTITLAMDIDLYPLSTDINTEENPAKRKNISAVKIAGLPTAWRYEFKVVSNMEFAKKVNYNRHIPFIQPVIGTIIDNQLKIYPIPVLANNGEQLELFVYLMSSTQRIDKDTEPELPEIWDKCLEYYASAQFLSGNGRSELMNEYTAELKRLRPIVQRKHFNLQAPRVF